MSLPDKLKQKYLARFDELIAEGEQVARSFQTVSEPSARGVKTRTITIIDTQRLGKWTTNCLTLLEPLLSGIAAVKERLELFKTASSASEVRHANGILEAVRDDLRSGFLKNLSLAIEAEIAADYMGQAEGLLKEGQTGKYDHVPAAVLTGAVLEKTLRKLCLTHQPPIAITDSKGDPKTLNPLIDDLKKEGVFNELKAKQLRAWADIRNKAAHGEFDQFQRKDVEQMVQGVNNFLTDHMGV